MSHTVQFSSPPVRTLTSRETAAPPLPYWLVNISRAQWTAECPSFLRNQSEKNINILATPDEHYVRQGWDLVREIVGVYFPLLAPPDGPR